MGNTRTFAHLASVNSMASTSARICSIDVVFKLSTLVAMFPSVLRRYLDDIFYNRMDVKNIIRFTTNFSFVVATNAIDPPDARSLLDLLRAFDIYVFIALSFVSHLTIR
jgi:hypothetical protein